MSMISKQVDALRSVAHVAKIEGHEMYANHMKAAADTIEEQAAKIHDANMERSSAHYNTGWIPCEDRLPEKEGQYIVTVKTDRGKTYCRPSHFYKDEGKWAYQTFRDEKLNKIFKVTAWMPLPEPYKEGDNED